MDPVLIETLREAQRFGFFGAGPIEDAIAHAATFVAPLAGCRHIVDLGSGGGLPGLVIAHELRGAHVTLVDRRQKRTDFLERAVGRLRWSHVEVVTIDVDVLVVEVDSGTRERFDGVCARGFGPPSRTLSVARALVARGGVIAVSEPPDRGANRWESELAANRELRMERAGPLAVFHVEH